jgi:talin
MEQIMVASGELISSYDSSEMVRQARILAQSTAELIQAIKGEAETQSDSDLQVKLPYPFTPTWPHTISLFTAVINSVV